MGIILFDSIDSFIVQRRDLPILLGTQAVEPCLACMNNEGIATGRTNFIEKLLQKLVRIRIVNADTRLDGNRNPHLGAHRPDTVSHQGGMRHQAGTKATILHPIRGASHIQVDFVIAALFGNTGTPGQLFGH